MRPTTFLSTLLLLLLLPATLASTSVSAPQQPPPEQTHILDLYTSPLGISPNTLSHLAKIAYTYPSLNATLTAYTPPVAPSNSESDTDHILKLGFFAPSTTGQEIWHGILTSPSLFASSQKKMLKLHLDPQGAVWHLGFSASPREAAAEVARTAKGAAKGKGGVEGSDEDAEITIVLVPATPGPKVQVNRPVVADKDGKAEGEGEEKTFLQKYWWAIALFLVVQVVMGGGGEK